MTVYYSPEQWNLEPFAELELTEPDYSFDLVVVWRHKDTGELYFAQDSGCSCPSPFEDFTSIDDLILLSTDNDYDCLMRVTDRADNRANRVSFLRKVHAAMQTG
jgi:hypothetical protein